MSLTLTEEQVQLSDTIRSWFETSYPLSEVRKVFNAQRAELKLAELTELGLAEISVSEDSSSGRDFTLDFTLRELGLFAFECGYALAPSALHLKILRQQDDAKQAKPISFFFDNGKKCIHFGIKDGEMLDRSQVFTVRDSVAAGLSKPDKTTSDAIYHCKMQALLANEAAGICARGINLTKDYVVTRKQFGRPIGTFQAVQHKLADLFLLAESLRTSAQFSCWAGSSYSGKMISPQFPFSSAAAATLASEVTGQIIEGCIQLHGGIAFTWEHDLHLLLRRANLLKLILKLDSHTEEIIFAGALNGTSTL